MTEHSEGDGERARWGKGLQSCLNSFGKERKNTQIRMPGDSKCRFSSAGGFQYFNSGTHATQDTFMSRACCNPPEVESHGGTSIQLELVVKQNKLNFEGIPLQRVFTQCVMLFVVMSIENMRAFCNIRPRMAVIYLTRL